MPSEIFVLEGAYGDELFSSFVINASLGVFKKSPSIWSCSLLLESEDFNLVFQNQVIYLYSLISAEDVIFW
jgi:hypothetical protein